MKKIPQKVAIIGLPGSGKSTFAIKLAKILALPVYHLDNYMFEGRRKRDRQEFLTIKEKLVSQERWIIEGCSFSTYEMRFAKADTVIYLHFSRLLCLFRVIKRLFQHQILDESGCLKGINWPLIKYIWQFDRDKRMKIEELRQKYPQVEFHTFRNFGELDRYLNGFINEI